MCNKTCPVCGREHGNHDPQCPRCETLLHDADYREAHRKATHHNVEREPVRQPVYRATFVTSDQRA